jgi:hypothetical protein
MYRGNYWDRCLRFMASAMHGRNAGMIYFRTTAHCSGLDRDSFQSAIYVQLNGYDLT